ncbi:MAG: phosphoenolpyruvate mutase [Lachnospiraceae bacterium]|nr:phosphoenolpyruvate mutase [Lachnospiraceae bacterium]
MSNLPEVRRGRLKRILEEKKFVRAMGASNGLMGLIVENVQMQGKEYDAMWISSLCDSALKGKPDNEVVDFTDRLHVINEIMEVTTKPLIVDGDTGGLAEHLVSHVKTLERIGVSAVVIEDKKGLKQNSLLGQNVQHILEDKDIFAEKIRLAKKAASTTDFMIFARIESFIANRDLEDAYARAEAYVKAGADGIMIHSYKSDGKEIIAFLKKFKATYPNVPTMVIPTAYSEFTEGQLKDLGADIVIYANHLLRSAYPMMLKTAEKILQDECCHAASEQYCMSMKEILEVIDERND